MGYKGETPLGATEFEKEFGLAPLGDDSFSRIERAEKLLGLFLSGAIDQSSDRARVWVGSFSPTQVEVPVPDASVVEDGLSAFRSPEEIAARDELDRLYPDRNEDG